MTQGPLPTPLNGCMGGIRNYTLAVNFFEIQDPEEYLKRNAKFHKWPRAGIAISGIIVSCQFLPNKLVFSRFNSYTVS